MGRTYQELAEAGDDHAARLDRMHVESTRPTLRHLLAEAEHDEAAALHRIAEHDELARSVGEPSLGEIIAACGGRASTEV